MSMQNLLNPKSDERSGEIEKLNGRYQGNESIVDKLQGDLVMKRYKEQQALKQQS